MRLLLLVSLALPTVVLAGRSASEAFKLADLDGDGKLDQKEAVAFADLLALEPSKDKPKAKERKRSPEREEFLAVDTSSDGSISEDELKTSLKVGRLMPKTGTTPAKVAGKLFPFFGDGFLSQREYEKAKAERLFTYKPVTPDEEKVILEGLPADPAKDWSWLSITASGLGKAEGKGPATFAWIREREKGKINQNTSRWDVDAKVAIATPDLLHSETPGQNLFLTASAEARIVDYNNREANQHEGTTNRLRYMAGTDYQFGMDNPWGHQISLRFAYDTDPSNETRSTSGIVTWEPNHADWGIGSQLPLGKFFGSDTRNWQLHWQPRFGVEVGAYDKENLDDTEVVSKSTMTKRLPDGTRLRTSSSTVKVRHTFVENDIARAIVGVDVLLNITPKLSIGGTYQMLAELNGENRVYQFAKLQLALRLPDFAKGVETSLTADYSFGQDAPTYERQDLLRLGVGLKY